MKKIICIILLLTLTLSCTSCSKKPAVVWGEAKDAVLSGETESPLYTKLDLTVAFGTDDAGGRITVNGAIFTENCIAFDIDAENYTISDVMVLAGDLESELSGYNSFEEIESEYIRVGTGETRRIESNDDNTSDCTIYCESKVSLKDNSNYTLVFTGSEFEYPVRIVIAADNYHKMKTVDVKNEKGDIVGIATISALYAEINMYPTKIDSAMSFTDYLFISAGRKNILPFEATVCATDGYFIDLDFHKILDIDNVDYLIYKG